MKKIILLLILLLVAAPAKASAASYDLYVDGSYGGDEEGTSEKPFTTIKKALEKAEKNSSGERKIYIKSGSYSENLTLAKGVRLYGQDKNNTVITGSGFSHIVLEEDNALENLTISGGTNAVTVNGKATINKCVIKNALKNGIDAKASNFQITIERSELTKNGKGAYIEKGRNVTIDGNYVHNNSEEGLDLRNKIRGTVTNNDITSNGEGGIEIIAGSSDVDIKNNTISKNKASGIANQFYPQAKTGKISILNNTISRNNDYGITCGAPSGGSKPAGYWSDSLNVLSNKIELNGKKSISGACDVMEAVKEEDKKTNVTIENPDPAPEEEVPIAQVEDIESAILAEELSIAKENEQYANETLEKSRSEEKIIWLAILENKRKIMEENKIKTFFVGTNQEKMSLLAKENERLKALIPALQETVEKIDSEEILGEIQKLAGEINLRSQETESFISERQNKFNLMGFFRRWL